MKDFAHLTPEELDKMDAGLAGHDAEEGESYFYDVKLRRNIILPERGVA